MTKKNVPQKKKNSLLKSLKAKFSKSQKPTIKYHKEVYDIFQKQTSTTS